MVEKLSKVRKVFFKNKPIKSIYKGSDLLWQSFKKVTYPCDLRGIDMDVLDKDSPKFNRDLAYAAWFLHRGIFSTVGYKIPETESEKNNAKMVWSSATNGIDGARSANLLYEAHMMQPSPSNGNDPRQIGYWNFADLENGEIRSSGGANFADFRSDKPHKLLKRYYEWSASLEKPAKMMGVCCNMNLDIERKYTLSFWYRIRNISDDSLDDIILIYPGFNETLTGFSVNIRSSGYNNVMTNDAPIRIKKSELILDNQWHRYKVHFATRNLRPDENMSYSGLRTMLGFFHPHTIDICLAGFCLKYTERDTDTFTTGFTFDTPRKNITKESENLFNAIADATFFRTHGYKIFHLCEYIPNLDRASIKTDDTDLHIAVEKRVNKLDEDLDELADWYRNTLPTLNVQTGFVSWRDILTTGEKTFTWKFKYKEKPKGRKDLGLITRYDRGGYSPKKYVKNVIVDMHFYSIKQASDNWNDYGPYSNYITYLAQILNRGSTHDTVMVLHVKYENLTPKEWVEDKTLRDKYLYEYAPGKYGLRFDVEYVVTMYNKWVENMINSFSYDQNIKTIILGIVGKDGRWTFGEGFRPVDAATLKKILLPWFNTWGIVPKIFLPKYLIEADNFGVKSFVNLDLDDINKSNLWFNTLKNGGVDSDIQNLNLVAAKDKLQDIRLMGLCLNHDSLTDLSDSQIDQVVDIIREQGLSLFGPINEKDLVVNKKKIDKLIKAIPTYHVHLSQVSIVVNNDTLDFTITIENRGEMATRITRVAISSGYLVNSQYTFSAPLKQLTGDDVFLKPKSQKVINITSSAKLLPSDHDHVIKIGMSFEGSDVGEYEGEGGGATTDTYHRQNFKLDFDTEELEGLSEYIPDFSLYLHNTEEQRRKRR